MQILWSTRTNFSVGESILSADTLFKKAKELGYDTVAIADTMSVSALIDSSVQAAKAGVDLISGCTLRVQHWSDESVIFSPKVYCKTGDAFVGLLKLLSNAEQDPKTPSFVKFSDFIGMLSSADYLVTTGDALSVFSSAFPASDVDELVERIRLAQKRAEEDIQLAIELVNVNTPYYDRLNKVAQDYAAATGIPTITSSMPLYLEPDHAEARDVMHAISRRAKEEDAWRNVLAHTDYSMRPGTPAGTLEIQMAKSLSWRWSKMPVSLPKMADDEFAELVNQCKAAWKDRIGSEFMGYKPDASKIQDYIDRLKMELGVLKTLGFCNYFLLVADLVRWAKANDIVVGPGRGSVGGSLVAFVLGITDVDPIRFNLLFERFINPERLDLPDADLDFMSARRHEVVEYLREKYGSECVAQISNYNTLGPASAIGDVGKFYGVPNQEMAFKSYLPKEHGQAVPLEDCKETVPELQQYIANHPKAYKVSTILEGALRSMGTHAAGVVVAAEPIENRAVVDSRGGSVGCVNWDKRVVEDMGLVKIDILGLTNLDVLARAKAKIKHDYGRDIDLLQLPLDDKKVLKAFGQGDTIGVFQFEGGGMRKLLKDLAKGGDLTFEELSAATALFRPGPIDSGLLDDYVAIRQGAATEHYEHPNMEAALKPTFGVIVYQEQVMQLARDLAGFTLAGADHLRKAMGKKDKEKMAEQRDKWVAGCKAHSGIDEAWSNALFDKIELFAGYAFNRSHSVEYAIISYWTMWLKVYYPHAFYAAALEVFKEDKLQGLVLDAAKRGIEILPPDINQSTSEFRRFGDHLMAPLNRVKGVGEPTERAILEAREKLGGSFKTVDDLINNVEKRKCNVRHRAILEEVGAFASIIPGSLPPRHPDRVKRQLELLPGLIATNVRAERTIVLDAHVKEKLTELYMELREEGAIVLPRFGKKPKIAIVLEAPTFYDEKAGKLMETDSSDFIKEALKACGLSLADCYVTTYLKRPKAGKTPTNDEILFAKPFFEREMELLKPPVILALGSFVARELSPDERGSIMDLNGKIVYDKDRDASLVLAISPGQIFHDPAKQTLLNEAVARAAELFS